MNVAHAQPHYREYIVERRRQYQPMSEEKWVYVVTNLATPSDFDTLIREGVLEKHGCWYKILKMDSLPVHAKAQIRVLRTTRNNGALARFRRLTRQAEKLLRSYEAHKKRAAAIRSKSHGEGV